MGTVLTLAGSLSILVTLSAAAFSVEAFIPFYSRISYNHIKFYQEINCCLSTFSSVIPAFKCHTSIS